MAVSRFVTLVLQSLVAVCLCAIPTEPPVELRWDFNDCGQTGRFGPSEGKCNSSYKGTSLEGDVRVVNGIQIWTVPATGLFLVTARGPSGSPTGSRRPGNGSDLTGEFHMTEGQRLKILVGQQCDSQLLEVPGKPIGGSGGTFIVRESDDYILMVAGGGSSGAGTKWNDWSIASDASLEMEGRNASKVRGLFGAGGKNKLGGSGGFLSGEDNSAAGGGAGYDGDGEKAQATSGANIPRSPRAAIAFDSSDTGDKGPGVGGFFMYVDDDGTVIRNEGGFGGGGSGSDSSGCGGGGGYSGGGGGSTNGWGGGGGSINNGGRPRNAVTNKGKGAVIISFIGHQCCGPVEVYIAMTFIAGILVTVLIAFGVYKIMRAIKSYDGKGMKICTKCFGKLQTKNKIDKNHIEPRRKVTEQT